MRIQEIEYRDWAVGRFSVERIDDGLPVIGSAPEGRGFQRKARACAFAHNGHSGNWANLPKVLNFVRSATADPASCWAGDDAIWSLSRAMQSVAGRLSESLRLLHLG